jgi:hypothetical protein
MRKLLLLLLLPLIIAAQRVSVNELGADPSGIIDSQPAFELAHLLAGPQGAIECEPGSYLFNSQWWIWQPQIKIDCPGSTIIAGPGVMTLIKVIQAEPSSEVSLIRVKLAGIDGSHNNGICLHVGDANFSDFQIDHIRNCGIGILVRPIFTRSADNTFKSLLMEANTVAIRLLCNGHHVQSNRFDVNFVANNDVGIDIPDTHSCASMFWFTGSMDFNHSDGRINSPNNWILSSFMTRGGRHLRASNSSRWEVLDLGNIHRLSTGAQETTTSSDDNFFNFLKR